MIKHPEKPLKEDVGTKAFNAFLLEEYATACNLFVTPTALAIPQGVLNKYKETGLSEILEKLDHMSEQEISNSYDEVYNQIHEVMQKNISSNDSIIAGIIASIMSYFPTGSLLAFRSSSNMEDLAKFAGAGLYDSVLPVAANKEEIYRAISQVWLSLYSKRALISRKKYGFPHKQASMAILVQEVIDSEMSFVVHTQNPVGSKGQQTIEMALGLGETLASSNIPGCPFRFSYEKGEVVLEDVASYTYKLGLSGKSYVDMTEHKILEKYEILEEYVK
jgi:phosphoglucan,water dikinase